MKMIIAFLALALSAQTFAYDLAHKFGVGAAAGFPIPVFGNSFNNVNNAKWDASVYARYHLTSSMGVDLGVSRDAFKGSSLKLDNLNILGFYRTAGTADLSPIVGAGIAFTRVKNFAPSSLKLSLLARLGLEYSLSEAFSIAGLVDYKYVSKIMGDMPGSRAHIVSPQLALTWYFGGTDQVKPESTPVAQEAAAKVEQVKEEFAIQKAPLKEEGLKIQQANGRDEIAIEVEFASGKSVVAPSYAAHLNQVANFFKKHPEVNVEIQGYTDNSGLVESNIKLSQKRADAVKNYLAKLGVDSKRITAKGFGPENPIADNSTAEGKQKNRRVIAVLK